MNFAFDKRDWTLRPGGSSLMGSESGIGAILSADGQSLVAGELREGVLHGWGFAFGRKEREISYTRPRTYEEVMETASFDAAGRPVHYESGPITIRKTEEDWPPTGIGRWENGVLACGPLAFPPGLVLRAQWREHMSGRVGHVYLPADLELREAGYCQKSWYHVYAQPLPDGRVLMVDIHGAVFALAPGESFTFDHGKNPICYNSYTYSLL